MWNICVFWYGLRFCRFFFCLLWVGPMQQPGMLLDYYVQLSYNSYDSDVGTLSGLLGEHSTEDKEQVQLGTFGALITNTGELPSAAHGRKTRDQQQLFNLGQHITAADMHVQHPLLFSSLSIYAQPSSALILYKVVAQFEIKFVIACWTIKMCLTELGCEVKVGLISLKCVH